MMKKNSSKIKRIYTVFGLKISSEIPISELLPSEGDEDIKIILGKVPSKIDHIIIKADDYQMSKTEFLFSVENVGRYYIKDGKLILIEPYEKADSKSINVYLMGTAFGVVLLQRGMVPIHGSSVIINDQCVIFTGDCGAGKSTLCSAFRKNEYEFLSDDISVITLNEEGIPMVQPAFPQQRLCSDSARMMGYDIASLSLASNTDHKYVISDPNNFKSEPMPLVAIFELCPKQDCTIGIRKLEGTDKLWNIIKNIYYSTILLRLGINVDYFKQCIDIVKIIPFYYIVRPEDKYTVKEQIEIVKKTLDILLKERKLRKTSTA
ncbi:hypothetical protein [Clostridium sp. JS66]|uniref:hypothetical protein n=1 Tax=Clostridium sp. JS66 TaxID=3064705 RepID=UPI00298E09D3|nr:hypothetical protein [Clostridium sp. JS66]WPC43296.1 hypothetical protein Q6H37_07435 [Clostridium sp. JS66]